MDFKIKVLIVEDDRSAQKIIRDLLESEFDITMATDGVTALDMARQIKPDLIISDIIMPKLDGLQFCAQVRQEHEISNAKIIFVTGKTDLKDRIAGYEAGVDDYITKPFEPEELLAKTKVYRRLIEEEKRKEAVEKALQESEHRFRDIADLLPGIILEITEDLKLTYVNLAGFKLFGYTPEDLENGLSIFDFLHPDEKKTVMGRISRHYQGGEAEPSEYKLVKKDGQTIQVLLNASPIKHDNKISGFRISITDITDAKKADRRIAASEKRHREILEGLNDLVFRISIPSGILEYCSQSVETIFGISVEKCIAKPFILKELLHPDFKDRFDEVWYQLKNGNIKKIYEYKIITPDGIEKWIVQSNSGIFDDDRNLVALESICRDITDKKQIEEEKEQLIDQLQEALSAVNMAAEKAESANKAKTEFINNITHELRSPLHHIINFAKFGTRKASENTESELSEFFEMIYISGNRLINLVDKLLDLAKIESGKMEYIMAPVDLKVMIEAIIKECKSIIDKDGLQVELSIEWCDSGIVCDVDKISTVIRNLFSNALKFSNRGGKIVFKLSEVQVPIIANANQCKEVPGIRLSIADEGQGIPVDELKKIFLQFYQSAQTISKTAGSGLGLSICKEIIVAHHGQIWAEDIPAGGARFSFIIPKEQKY